LHSACAFETIQESCVGGGLVVCIGVDVSESASVKVLDELAELAGSGGYLIQCLDADGSKVAKVREYVRTKGLYGVISADVFDGRKLPYIDNLVNCVVVLDAGCKV
jgi:hypothetical protein